MKATLFGMTDFVLEQENLGNTNVEDFINYAQFLKRSLTLDQFVPCDFEGNVLEMPHNFALLNLYPTGDKLMDASFSCALEYKEALGRVIFEGFEFNYNSEVIKVLENKEGCKIIFAENDPPCTIEDIVHENITLTDSISKELRLTK